MEEQKREERHVDRPFDVAQVVPRALVGDSLRLFKARGGRFQKERKQPIVAIVNRLAVRFEDVAKRREASRNQDQHETRAQAPAPAQFRQGGLAALGIQQIDGGILKV